MHETSQNVLDHGNNNATIIITCSNLLNWASLLVFSWCTSVDKLNTHVVNRASSLKFEAVVLEF